MRISLRLVLVIAVLATASTARAQTSVDPSGHWEGAISLPNGAEIPFEVDFSKKATGEIVATYNRPDNSLKGFPLTNVVLDGRAIGFLLTGNTRFQGALLSDGKTISGDVTAPIGNAPFNMSRTGDAQIIPAPKNAIISKDFEGDWNGTLTVQGQKLILAVRMSNQADGTAVGTIAIVNQGGAQFPLGLTQKGSSLTLAATQVGGEFFTGALNASGELTGTFTEGPISEPLRFQRGAAHASK